MAASPRPSSSSLRSACPFLSYPCSRTPRLPPQGPLARCAPLPHTPAGLGSCLSPFHTPYSLCGLAYKSLQTSPTKPLRTGLQTNLPRFRSQLPSALSPHYPGNLEVMEHSPISPQDRKVGSILSHSLPTLAGPWAVPSVRPCSHDPHLCACPAHACTAAPLRSPTAQAPLLSLPLSFSFCAVLLEHTLPAHQSYTSHCALQASAPQFPSLSLWEGSLRSAP